MMMTIMIRVIIIRLLFATATKLNDYYVPGTGLPTLQIISLLIFITFLYVCTKTPIKYEKSPS